MSAKVLVSLRVLATPERAFEAFTGSIHRWWKPNGLFQFTTEAGGRLAFEGGPGGRLVEISEAGERFDVGRVRAWEPGRRLVFGWRCASFGPGHATEVEVTFEPVGEETRVTVEHRGCDTIPQPHAARHDFPLGPFQQRQAEHWRALLAAFGYSISPPPSAT